MKDRKVCSIPRPEVYLIMATTATQHAPAGNTLDQVIEPLARETKPAKHDVVAEMNYYVGEGLPAIVYVGQENPDRPHAAHEVTIHDISGDENKYTLDSHGFQYVKHVSKDKDFSDNKRIKDEYYPEVEQILKEVTGATRVFIFNDAVRRLAADPTVVSDGKATQQVFGPGKRVHIDQSYTTAENTVRYYLPDEADELLKKRFQIINVWRPIKTIRRDPFALADASTVPESDLLAAARVYPDRTDETWVCRPNPNHRWYFKYAQQPDELLMFKCFDSVNDGRAKRSPHSAFSDPAHDDEPPRESVECRTLVFYDE